MYPHYHPSVYLTLEDFATMDRYAVEEYQLPIELMMENAGLHLATLVADHKPPGSIVRIGVGNGNNGGGGLVAARRLAAWGYAVFLDLPVELTRELPSSQLERALAHGLEPHTHPEPEVWLDAYLGFSQRLPLSGSIAQSIEEANHSNALRISLDIPTGISADSKENVFQAHHVLTLAAPKAILKHLPESTVQYVADLGIHRDVYNRFGIEQPPFHKGRILKVT